MLLAHVFGASLVEGFITAFGLIYLQQHHPEYLTSLKRYVAGDDAVETGQAAPARPTWQLIGGGIVLIVLALFRGRPGSRGGGDPSQLFGADWASVDWAAVATMLLLVGVHGGHPHSARVAPAAEAHSRAWERPTWRRRSSRRSD